VSRTGLVWVYRVRKAVIDCVGEGKQSEMSRSRFTVLLILLVLILVAASILFGVLTYGLDGEEPPTPTPSQGSGSQHTLVGTDRQVPWIRPAKMGRFG
jgi:hypothetical protein